MGTTKPDPRWPEPCGELSQDAPQLAQLVREWLILRLQEETIPPEQPLALLRRLAAIERELSAETLLALQTALELLLAQDTELIQAFAELSYPLVETEAPDEPASRTGSQPRSPD